MPPYRAIYLPASNWISSFPLTRTGTVSSLRPRKYYASKFSRRKENTMQKDTEVNVEFVREQSDKYFRKDCVITILKRAKRSRSSRLSTGLLMRELWYSRALGRWKPINARETFCENYESAPRCWVEIELKIIRVGNDIFRSNLEYSFNRYILFLSIGMNLINLPEYCSNKWTNYSL